MNARVIAAFCAVLIAVLVTGSPHLATAQQGKSSVAFVNIKRILNESQAAVSIRRQVAKMSRSLASDFKRAQQKWRKERKNLVSQRPILSPERFAQRVKEFERRVKSEQATFRRRRDGIDKNLQGAMAKVQGVFAEIAKAIAKRKSISVLFKRSSAVLIAPTLDITPEVLKRLNKRLPSVVVPLSTGKPKPRKRN